MNALAVFLDVVHTLTIGGWFGCQIYSVTLVQRHPAMERDSAAYEDFICDLGRNARWTILAVLAAALPAWVGIVLIRALTTDVSPLWVGLAAAKSAFLLVAIAFFAYLSWHLWPLRLFALPDELPQIRRTFWWTSTLIMCALATSLTFGIVANAV
jgi:hypothetical protein